MIFASGRLIARRLAMAELAAKPSSIRTGWTTY
jgi:hypothetical protein